MMSSFLVNSALILLCSTAVVQFCTQAFEGYAQQTAIQEVFGNEIFYLESARPIFQNNVFIYILLGFSVLTALYLMVRGTGNRRHKKLTLEEIYAMG
jgi:LMBR1 domain-containing protein 1